MKRISTVDVAKIVNNLEGMNVLPINLINPEYDDLVAPYLNMLGIDINQGIGFVYNKHRTLDNHVVEAYSYVGDIRYDEDFRKSPFCDESDRLILIGMKDQSLLEELQSMQRVGGTFSNLREVSLEDKEDFSKDNSVLEDSYNEAESLYEKMNKLVDEVRGGQFNESGKLKTFEEYKKGSV